MYEGLRVRRPGPATGTAAFPSPQRAAWTAPAPPAPEAAESPADRIERAERLGHSLERLPAPEAPAPGRPLTGAVRARMEAALGADFSRVRVFEGEHVPAVGALAYARGDELHFAPGRYRPATPAGQEMLGHELTHVVQQRERRVATPRGEGPPLNQSPALEAEAHGRGHRAARGLTARGGSAGAGGHVPARAAPAAASPMQGILMKMDADGKVRYVPDTYANRAWARWKGESYSAMQDGNFGQWKGAGKRTPSSKVTDPSTGKNYSYDHANQQFHEYDKTQPNQRGNAVSTQSRWWGLKSSENQSLLDRLNKGQLIDRRRADRSGGNNLEPFDVGTYQQPATVTTGGYTRTYPMLPTAHGAWTANNDHIVSGASLQRRNALAGAAAQQAAYDQGPTIAIDNPNMHVPISPTYGGRQQKTDTNPDATTGTRVNLDRDHPARAMYRDVFTMLDRTSGMNTSAAHANHQAKLDLTQPANRLRQMGAYRTQYRMNTRFNQHIGPGRGIDPTVPGQAYALNPLTNNYQYSLVPGKTQGQLMSEGFMKRLKDENFVA